MDFWDVGQGDATAIRLPDGRLVLIDVGPMGSPVIDWLTDHPRTIYAVVVTHNDRDHAGALPSLVKIAGVSIRTVYMLQDRDKRSAAFQNIWRPVRDEELKNHLAVLALSKDTVIWQSGNLALTAVYPTFSENIEATRPNQASAIICLLHKGETKVIWPGDAPMQIVAEKCRATDPHLLHGPHHGGPVDKNSSGFKDWVQSVKPERLLVSVGTNNADNLPSRPYLRQRVEHGCKVTCTQLTRLCDNIHVTRQTPLLQTAALLGLRPPRHGVPCRGCLRLMVEGGNIVADPWDAEHLHRVKTLRRAQCI